MNVSLKQIKIEKEKEKDKDEEMLAEIYRGTIQEAITHFNKAHIRRKESDARFFFKKQDVEIVVSGVRDPKSITVGIESNSDGSFFCYRIDCVYNTEKDIRKSKKQK